jgi:hypothetical protein
MLNIKNQDQIKNPSSKLIIAIWLFKIQASNTMVINLKS